MLSFQGEHDAAIERLRHAVAVEVGERPIADARTAITMAALAQESQDLGLGVSAWQAGSAAAERAARESDMRANAWYNLAAYRSVRNDFEGTEECLRAAIAIAPNWYKPHWMLARLLHEARRADEARQEAKIALDLNAGEDEEVTETWEALRGAARE